MVFLGRCPAEPRQSTTLKKRHHQLVWLRQYLYFENFELLIIGMPERQASQLSKVREYCVLDYTPINEPLIFRLIKKQFSYFKPFLDSFIGVVSV